MRADTELRWGEAHVCPYEGLWGAGGGSPGAGASQGSFSHSPGV